MADQHTNNPLDNMQPPCGAFAFTPSDSADITHPSRTNSDATAFKPMILAVIVAAASTLKVTMRSGDTVTIPVQAGLTPMQITKLFLTGTTLGSGSTVVCFY